MFFSLSLLCAKNLFIDAGFALTALVNHQPLWKIDTNLFEVYGLPNSREALRKLLG